jgi:hypothetical protein
MKTIPDKITIGDKYDPAMKITAQEEADEYFEACVQHSMVNLNKTRDEAEQLERTNLGYYAGYYDSETRARVEKLFKCSHPVFGAIAENGQPTAEEAWSAGYARGQATKSA